jgi:hypothetical protein
MNTRWLIGPARGRRGACSQPVSHGLLELRLGGEFPQFVHGAALDLPDPFLTDAHLAAEFAERSRRLAVETEPGHHDPPLAGFEFGKEAREQVLEHRDLVARAVVVNLLGGSPILERLVVGHEPLPQLPAAVREPIEVPLDGVCGVGAEPVAEGEVELLHRPHQGQVAFAHEFLERPGGIDELLRDRHD